MLSNCFNMKQSPSKYHMQSQRFVEHLLYNGPNVNNKVSVRSFISLGNKMYLTHGSKAVWTLRHFPSDLSCNDHFNAYS